MRLALFLAGLALSAQTRLAPDQIREGGPTPPLAPINIRSIITSSTQAAIRYTAPDTSPCQLVISEGSSVGHPVIDLDPALFTGADSDARAESLTDGRERVFVAGKRKVAKALDGRYYSLALQALTEHTYRVTCGANQTEGRFVTSNIPSGVTFADAFQVDPERPGKWMLPTQLQDRKQSIRDPQTGALLRRVSLDAEKNGGGIGGMILSYGGMIRNCGIEKITAPDHSQGYICVVFDQQAMGEMYWVIVATGEVRYLGKISHGYPYVSGQKVLFWVDGSGNVFKQTYAGDFTEVPAGQEARFTDAIFYSGPMNELVKKYDPSFRSDLFGCAGAGADAGKYAQITCTRSGQDSYGWVATFYGGDGRPVDINCADGDKCPRIVAAINVMNARACRWCTLHNQQLVPGYPLISINYQRLVDWSGAIGRSPWITTTTREVLPSDTVIHLNGQPKPLQADPYAQDLGIGDLIAFGGGPDEVMRAEAIVSNGSGLDVRVTRDIWQNGGPRHWPASYGAWMMCSGWGSMGYWKFLEDPHGADTSNTKFVNDYYWGYGGHMDNGPLGRVEEAGNGWQAVYGDIMQNLNKPISLLVNDTVQFAGAQGLAYGSTTSKHPSYHQDGAQTTTEQQRWFLDYTPFDGSNVISDPNATYLISGQLYKYSIAPGYGADVKRKSLPTSASTGGESLRDLSGPNSHIGDGAEHSYSYCIADVKAGECRPDSRVGDIYINAPNVQYRSCSGGDGPNPQNKDLCLGNLNVYYQGVNQVYLSQVSGDDATQKSRVLTRAINGLKGGLYYSLAKSLPDASWLIFTSNDPDTGNSNAWLAKVPPLDTAGDGIDRRTFIGKPVTIPKPGDSRITAAALEFGYSEDGAWDAFRCTTRADSCIATAAAVDPAHPFAWASEAPAPMPCVEGCTISIPLVPMRVAYWRTRYYDSSGSLISSGPIGIVMDGANVVLNRRSTR